jgi:hypothetical protein
MQSVVRKYIDILKIVASDPDQAAIERAVAALNST